MFIRRMAYFTLLAFIFTIPWETAITVDSIGTLTRVIGLCLAGIWTVSVAYDGGIRKIQLFHFIAFAFIVYSATSILWTASDDLTMQRLQTYVQLAVMTCILWDLLMTSEELHAAMQAFILGSWLAVGSSIYNFLSGTVISTYEMGRYTGAGQNAVELALILALSVPIAWHLATTRKTGYAANFLRLVNFVYVPAALLSALLTGSRMALLVNVAGVLYILGTLSFRGKLIHRVLIAAVLIGAFFFEASFIPKETLFRLSSVGDSISQSDFGGRGRLWLATFSLFLEHPFFGIGAGALHAPAQLGGAAHNSYLSVLAELGMFGFFLFASMICNVIFKAVKQQSPFSGLWITVLVIWLFGVFTLTWEFTKTTWYILNMVIISSAIYGRLDDVDDAEGDELPALRNF